MRTSVRPDVPRGDVAAPQALPADRYALTPDEVRRRFEWAKRQGNPAWLWPDVSVESWREALLQIEAVARDVLAGREAAVLDGDADAISLAGYTSGVGPLLGCWLEQGLMAASPTVASVLELHLAHNRVRAARMEAACLALTDALLRAEIPVAVLKGAHTGRAYFPEPGARPASDIDLLVRGEHLAGAEAVLRAAGFSLEGRHRWESSWRPAGAASGPRSLMHVHAEDPWSLDLHSSLNHSIGDGAPFAELDAARPMDSRRAWPLRPGALALEQPLLLLHLAAHAGSGLHSLTLLRLIEQVLVIRKDAATDALDWDAFLEAGERARALAYAYPSLRLVEDLAPGLVPEVVLERCARAAPEAVVRLVGRFTPATAHRVDRSSVSEHFMWSRGWLWRWRQLAYDLWPRTGWTRLWSIYETRAWRLIRGRLSP